MNLFIYLSYIFEIYYILEKYIFTPLFKNNHLETFFKYNNNNNLYFDIY